MPHSFGPQSSPSGMENFQEVSDLFICLSLFVHSRIKCLSSYINHTCNTPCWAFGGKKLTLHGRSHILRHAFMYVH
jgi:hypothetical protein